MGGFVQASFCTSTKVFGLGVLRVTQGTRSVSAFVALRYPGASTPNSAGCRYSGFQEPLLVPAQLWGLGSGAMITGTLLLVPPSMYGQELLEPAPQRPDQTPRRQALNTYNRSLLWVVPI